MADPVFNPPGCQVPAVEPIEPLPDVVCELPDPDLTPIRDCPDPLFPTRGRPGEMGPPGRRGEVGPLGEMGLKGETGDPGDRGPTGPQGPQGPQGHRGRRGPQGRDGPRGNRGTTAGPRGPKGVQAPKCYNGDCYWLQGPTGEPGDPGDPDKAAIVPCEQDGQTTYVGLLCVEMPECYFEDVGEVILLDRKHLFHLDERFLAAIEPDTLVLTAAVPELPVPLGGRIFGDKVELSTDCELPPKGIRVQIRVAAIRRGHKFRFPEYTYDAMMLNNSFWATALDD